MIRHHLNFVADPWFRHGIRGAVANLIISGSGLACLLWFSASASLSNEQVSLVPGVLLVYVAPLLMIGFGAGSLASRYHFGNVMMVVAALFGSSTGFLAGAAFLLPILETGNRLYYQGTYIYLDEELPILRYAGWVALATTFVGVLLAAGVIILTRSIRKVVKRTG